MVALSIIGHKDTKKAPIVIQSGAKNLGNIILCIIKILPLFVRLDDINKKKKKS